MADDPYSILVDQEGNVLYRKLGKIDPGLQVKDIGYTDASLRPTRFQ